MPEAGAPCAPTQRHQQFTAQCAAWQHIQAHIVGLGRALFPHVIRIRVSKASGNLFGRAALGQMYLDILPQPGIQAFARSSLLTGPGCRLRLGRAGAIGTAPCRIAGVSAHGARGTAQHPGHHS